MHSDHVTDDPGHITPTHHHLHSPTGGRLHWLGYESGGAPTSPTPVVCLHDVAGCAWVWHGVAGVLARRGRRVYVPDLRGHGDSQWSAGRAYRTADHAADLSALLDRLVGDGPCHLVGAGWGGLIALTQAVAGPDRVRSLSLVGAEPSSARSVTEVRPCPGSFVRQAAVEAWEAAAAPRAPRALVALLAAQGVRPGPRGLLYRKHDPYFLTRRPHRLEDHWAALERVHCPTLVVRGGAAADPDVTREMTAGLRYGVRAEIPWAGSAVPVEAPRELGRELIAFLAEADEQTKPGKSVELDEKRVRTTTERNPELHVPRSLSG